MIKRNRFKEEPGKLTLFPDYGNLNFFIILGFLSIPFVYALHWVDAQHQHIGTKNILYIIAFISLLLLLGFVSAFKKVTLDISSESLQVSLLGLGLKTVAFRDILMVDERSGTLPPAFYIVLKKNSFGTSVRLSATYNQYQQNGKYEYQYQILPLIHRYLSLSNYKEQNTEPATIRHFRLIATNVYRYRSVQQIVFSIVYLAFSVFLFIACGVIFFEPWSAGLMIGFIIALLGGLLFAGKFLSDCSSIYIDTQSKILTKKSLLGFNLAILKLGNIQRMKLRNTSINGLIIYTSLYAASKDANITIDKSIGSQRLSALDKELSVLLKID